MGNGENGESRQRNRQGLEGEVQVDRHATTQTQFKGNDNVTKKIEPLKLRYPGWTPEEKRSFKERGFSFTKPPFFSIVFDHTAVYGLPSEHSARKEIYEDIEGVMVGYCKLDVDFARKEWMEDQVRMEKPDIVEGSAQEHYSGEVVAKRLQSDVLRKVD